MDYTNGVYNKHDYRTMLAGPGIERFRIEFSFEDGQKGGHYILSTSLKNAIETMLRTIESWNLGQDLVAISGRIESYGWE